MSHSLCTSFSLQSVGFSLTWKSVCGLKWCLTCQFTFHQWRPHQCSESWVFNENQKWECNECVWAGWSCDGLQPGSGRLWMGVQFTLFFFPTHADWTRNNRKTLSWPIHCEEGGSVREGEGVDYSQTNLVKRFCISRFVRWLKECSGLALLLNLM